MTPEVDFDSVVDPLALDVPADFMPTTGSMLHGGRIGTFSLADAVRMVVEEWASNPIKQASAMILSDDGPGWTTLAAIRALYDHSEFPAKA